MFLYCIGLSFSRLLQQAGTPGPVLQSVIPGPVLQSVIPGPVFQLATDTGEDRKEDIKDLTGLGIQREELRNGREAEGVH
jgi:hypothetical protein